MSPLEILLFSMAGLFLLGIPIFMALAASSCITLLCTDILPLSIIHNSLFDGLNIFPLLAVPSFVVAGTLMEYGNITNQIITVVKQVVGRSFGGLGICTILACTFFAAIAGSGTATTAAIGAILIPSMMRNSYKPEHAAAITAAGGTIGTLIPPSNSMIMFAVLGNVSVTGLFTAGFIPGFIVAFSLCLTTYIIAKKNNYHGDENFKFDLKEFLTSCRKGFFSLFTPFIVLGSIYLGIATPVEASIIAVAYAIFVGAVINRCLTWLHIWKAIMSGVMVCGTVVVIVATSTLLGKILTLENAPLKLSEMITTFSSNPVVVLLLIVGMLYILGMFMETLVLIIILTPVLMPTTNALGIDPIQFGILMVLATNVGMLTPPLGVNLFVSSRIAKTTVEKVFVGVMPFLLALTVCVLILTLFPSISTFLPHLLGYQ